MNVNGGRRNQAYPSIAEGRPAWCREDLKSWLSNFVDERDAWLIERDLVVVKTMSMDTRRAAWCMARKSLRTSGCWTDGGCNDQADVDGWSPLFRRFVVWLA